MRPPRRLLGGLVLLAAYAALLLRAGGGSLSAGGKSDGVATLSYRCVYIKAEYAKAELETHCGGEPAKGAKQLPFTVAVDKQTNTLRLRGPAKLIGKVKTFLASLDRRRPPLRLPTQYLERYPVRKGQAERLAKILQLYQSDYPSKIGAVSPDEVAVWADGEDQIKIQRYLHALQRRGKGDVPAAGALDSAEPFLAVHAVPAGQAEPLAQILQKVYKGDPVTKVALVDPNSVAVWAVPEWQQAIANYLKALPRRSRGSRPGA